MYVHLVCIYLFILLFIPLYFEIYIFIFIYLFPHLFIYVSSQMCQKPKSIYYRVGGPTIF